MISIDNKTTCAISAQETQPATAKIMPPAYDPDGDCPEGAKIMAQLGSHDAPSKTPTESNSSDNVAATINTDAIPPVVECYYDPGRKCYWLKTVVGQWIQFSLRSLKNKLKKAGFRAKKLDDERLSEVDDYIDEIETNRFVDYAAGLAGHDEGFYGMCGNRVLVTRSPKLIDPKPGKWDTLRRVFEGTLASADPEQVIRFYSWIKAGWEALKARTIAPAQALAFVGPAGCGKSFIQNVITEIFGGRSAKCFRYMTGDTSFNYDLFQAEHLMIEDEQARLDMPARRRMGQKIKEFCVNVVQSCHGKNRDAISLTPWWRLSISLNDEGENVTALPPMDDSIKDKFMIFRCSHQLMPMPTDTPEHRRLFWERIMGELPPFLYWLEHEFVIPARIHDPRYRVAAYHHPSIIEILAHAASEMQLLDLIDQSLFCEKSVVWEGTASQLQSQLFNHPGVGQQARGVLTWNNATGTLLGNLAKHHTHRVQKAPNNSRDRRWRIHKSTTHEAPTRS
jgi:hypothetical protein